MKLFRVTTNGIKRQQFLIIADSDKEAVDKVTMLTGEDDVTVEQVQQTWLDGAFEWTGK